MLGATIKMLRKDAGLTQEELSDLLEQYRFSVARTTISVWENTNPDVTDPTWNPRFIQALAEIFDISEVELLDRLGFEVVPDGYTLSDVEFARSFSRLPDAKKEKVLRLLLDLMDILEED